MPHANSKYTEQLGERICELLRTGKTLRAVCRRSDVTVKAETVLGWCEKPLQIMGPDGFMISFREQYARARQDGYFSLFEQMVQIVDDCPLDMPSIQKAKLKTDVLKWQLSKALPRLYGDSIAIEHAGEIATTHVDPRDLARSIMDVLAEGSSEEIMLQIETDATKH